MATPKINPISLAISRLLRPIIALLLKNGVIYQDFAARAKEAYVAVAAKDYGKRGRPTNNSRIALLTGLDRKEIKRIRDQQTAALSSSEDQLAQPGRLGRVLSAWFQDTRYMHDGTPRPLQIDTEFVELCREYGGDVPVSAILKELKAVGAVSATTSGKVIATSRYYMPDQADPAALLRGSNVLRDVCDTVTYNLYRAEHEPSRFEGRATNLAIAPADAAAFHQFLDTRGQQFLEEIDAWLSSREQSATDQSKTLRVGVGLYGLQSTAEIDNNH